MAWAWHSVTKWLHLRYFKWLKCLHLISPIHKVTNIKIFQILRTGITVMQALSICSIIDSLATHVPFLINRITSCIQSTISGKCVNNAPLTPYVHYTGYFYWYMYMYMYMCMYMYVQHALMRNTIKVALRLSVYGITCLLHYGQLFSQLLASFMVFTRLLHTLLWGQCKYFSTNRCGPRNAPFPWFNCTLSLPQRLSDCGECVRVSLSLSLSFPPFWREEREEEEEV